jgi:hypothetical protein
MPKSTTVFNVFPWVGGINTSVDKSVVDPQELIAADNTIFDSRGAKRVREGINFNWDNVTASTDVVKVVGMHQYFQDPVTSPKSSYLLSITDEQKIYTRNNGGIATELTVAGTPYSDAITKASFTTIANKAVICVDGYDNTVKVWDGSGDVEDLTDAPRASICGTHLGRLWLNDKTNKDRLHYCQTGDITKWNGQGDSGAIDIGFNDNDPDGITAIFPTFNGDLFVAKKTKLYKISGLYPETFRITLVSSGIGCISHNSVTAVDQTDVFFVSERGVHSLVTTSNYGDFEAKFLSEKIHPSFINDFNYSRLEYTSGAYIPELQSVLFTFSEKGFTGEGIYQNSAWLYNIQLNIWYRWPDIVCESVTIVQDSDRRRPYFGGANDKIAKGLTGDLNDIYPDALGDDEDVAIKFFIQTGIIYIENPYIVKGFKKFVLYFRPENTHNVSVAIRIDNYDYQELPFSEPVASDLLDVDFLLDSSILGSDLVLSPYTKPIDGYGRGIQITISHENIDQFIEIQGFGVEYEKAGTAQEVIITE